MWQAFHYHSTAASIKVCSFNAVSICLCPVQPRFIGRYAVGPANCLRHNAGDVGTVHPAAVDACCTIAPVCPKHQAKRNSSLVVRVKGACGLLRKTSDLWEHRTSLLAWASGLEAAPPLKNWPECVSGLHQSWTPGRETVWGRLQERNTCNWCCCSCFNLWLPRFCEHQHPPNTATGWWGQMTALPHFVSPFWQSLPVQSFHSNTVSTTQNQILIRLINA